MTAAAANPQARVRIYASRLCPYCIWARQLLASRGITYELMDVDRNPQLWADMEARSGRRTVPQIFVNDRAIGGYEDLAALDSRGELQRMLGLQAHGA